jgi:putative alpha-1,2-mannosidase
MHNTFSFKQYYTLLIILSSLIFSPAKAISECCQAHSGICGDQCCDKTPIPKNCGDIQIIKLPPPASPTGQTKSEADEALIAPPKWLYVWTDPYSGMRHLSTTFPPWYRNAHYPAHSPRVLVYDEYNRLIDDTDQNLSAAEMKKRLQQAQANQQEQKNYQQKQKKRAEIAQKKKQLEKWLEEWKTTQKVTEEMNQLLEELAKLENVTIAMTDAQVKKALGKPKKSTEVFDKGQFQKILTYPRKQIIFIDGRVRGIKHF